MWLDNYKDWRQGISIAVIDMPSVMSFTTIDRKNRYR